MSPIVEMLNASQDDSCSMLELVARYSYCLKYIDEIPSSYRSQVIRCLKNRFGIHFEKSPLVKIVQFLDPGTCLYDWSSNERTRVTHELMSIAMRYFKHKGHKEEKVKDEISKSLMEYTMKSGVYGDYDFGVQVSTEIEEDEV